MREARRYHGQGSVFLQLYCMYTAYTIFMYVCIHTQIHIYVLSCMCVCMYTCGRKKLCESSAEVAAKGKHFYANVLTSGRSQISAILNNHHINIYIYRCV